MKTINTLAVVGLVVALGTIASVVIIRRRAPQEPPVPRAQVVREARPVAPPAVVSPEPVEATTAPPESTPPAEPVKAVAQSKVKPQPTAQPDPPPKDETARVALSFVGADPEAEEYWMGAINDPSLSADERQNLIEDLNEDGLSDPKHPTINDLPLILNRLWLIEALADSAMDKVNADAFQEAYKDLINLRDLAMGGGKPVN